MNLQKIVLGLSILLIMTACGKKPNVQTMIPKTASMVVVVDLKSFASKAVKVEDLLNQFMDAQKQKKKEDTNVENKEEKGKPDDKKNEDLSKKLLGAGIDFLSPVYIFGEPHKDKSKSYVAIAITLSDEGKFETFVKETAENKEVKKGDGYSYGAAFHQGTKALVGFANKVAVFVSRENGDEEAMKADLKTIFATKEGESLMNSDDRVKKIFAEQHDFLMWMDASKMAETHENTSLAGPTLKDNFVTASFDFNKGEIVFDCKGYLQDNVINNYGKVLNKGVSNQMVSNIPGPNPLALLSLSLNIPEIKKMLATYGLWDGAKESAKMAGVTADEIADMLSGEVGLTLEGVVKKPKKKFDDELKKEIEIMKDEPEYVLSIGIKNKATLDKIISSPIGMMLKKEDGYYSAMGDNFLIIKDNAIYQTNSKRVIDQIKQHSKPLDSKYADLMTKNAIAIYANLNELKSKFPDEFKPKDLKIEDIPIETFTANLSGIDKECNLQIKITFKDKEEYSAASLVKIMMDAQKTKNPL